MLREQGQRDSNNGHGTKSERKRGRQTSQQASYPAWSPDFGLMPRRQSLPLWQAMLRLPRLSWLVLSRPPAFQVFFAEIGTADWKIVWFQLLFYAGGAALLSWLRLQLYPSSVPISAATGGLNNPAVLEALNSASSLGLLLLIPLLFFFTMGLLYWLARAAGGYGEFVPQAHTCLLFLLPCGLLICLLGLIPELGSFLSVFSGLLLYVYCIAQASFATVAVHQISGVKAARAVLISALLLIPATIACLVAWTLLWQAL